MWSQIPKVDYPRILEDHWKLHLAERLPDAPTVISTFAGCGGSSLGYSMAGFKELLAVEWDDNAVATFKLNFPGIPVYHGDIAKISVEDILKRTGLQPGQLDILDGSPPCQGFSTAGKRCMDDDRNQLFREYVRLLRGLQPKVFVMENVSGMVKGKMKLIFVEILKELKASGYEVSARLLNAMYFNVPQSRQRMIFIGVRNDLGAKPSHPNATTLPIIIKDALNNVKETKAYQFISSEKEKLLWQKCKPGQSFADHDPNGNYYTSGKLNPNVVSGTILKDHGSNSFHWAEPRKLTITELQRLTSFPDAFNFLGNYPACKERIGNCVPPLFMYAIAKHIKENILCPNVARSLMPPGEKSS